MTKEGKPQRTFIEQFLPVKEISTEAKKEKSGRPPMFEMHYWWTRKPLIVTRAVILGALFVTRAVILCLVTSKSIYPWQID